MRGPTIHSGVMSLIMPLIFVKLRRVHRSNAFGSTLPTDFCITFSGSPSTSEIWRHLSTAGADNEQMVKWCLSMRRRSVNDWRRCRHWEPRRRNTEDHSRNSGGYAGLPFNVHPHMLRLTCGFALANRRTSTRTLQSYLGHRPITSTVRYAELAPGRFKHLWC